MRSGSATLPLDPAASASASAADWLVRLCAVDSTSGGEDRLLPLLQAWLRELGAEVRVQRLDRCRANILATWGHLRTGNPAEPRLLFTTHLDTVPPFRPPRRIDDAIWGRGACDAKGQIVAQLKTIEHLLALGEHRLAWLGVVGEETDGAGAEAASRWSEMPRELWAVVNGEPTEGRPTRAQKGCLHLALECAGVAGHGALAENDDNALWRLHRWLARLAELPARHHPLFGQETFNLGLLAGGEAPNVVAAKARAELVVRTIPGSTFVDDAMALAPAGSRVERLSDDPPLEFWVPAGWPAEVVAFGSDAPRLASLVPEGRLLQVGPGSIALAHGDDERIGLRELDEGIETLARLALELLAEPSGRRP